MKNLFFNSSISLFLLLVVLPLNAEHVFLKDGTILKGKIISETANDVILRDEQNRVTSFPHSKVMRVLYTNLKMGKIYIQKKDGEGIVAYMVDEDQDNYVFRKDLYKPAEFVISRSDVLFLSEKNPSKLKTAGNVGTDSVSLSWMPPYDAVKKYNIYIKKKKADKFELIDNTKNKSITLKDLIPMTNYYIIVTSVDTDNYESLPSNELKISTSARVDVKLKNGKSFKAYLLSEERDSYTLCYNLNKPADFVVKRADVDFITERFPSNLTGNAGFDTISLKWAEPYIPMKEYKIYVKKKGEDYKLVSISGNNSFTLRGLLSSTEYFIKVTGIAKDKSETSASNEIVVFTLNHSPFATPGLKITQQKTGESFVEWKSAIDPDGTITKYKIYKIKNNKKELIGETKDTSFKISKTTVIDRVMVSAVDAMGAESEASGTRINQKDIFRIFISPEIMFPLGTFGTMSSFGFGGNVSFMAQNLFVNGYTLGIEFSYFYTLGVNSLTTLGINNHGINLVTAALKTGYAFKVSNFFFITPAVSFGYGYINMTYTSRSRTTMTDTENLIDTFDPMLGASLSLDFIVSDNFFIGINGGYGLFFETTQVFQFITCGINFGVRF